MADLEQQHTNHTNGSYNKHHPEHIENAEVPLRLRHQQGLTHNIDGDVGHESTRLAPPSKGFYGHIGNPGVLGLASHGVTLLLVASQFMRWRSVVSPQVYVGNLYFFSGLYMLLTSQWCLVKGETFSHMVFGTFSAFYLSYAAILTPAFNVFDSYAGAVGSGTGTDTLYNSLGIFLMVWNIIFTIIFLISLRTNLLLVIVFFGVSVGVFLLGAMYFSLANATLHSTSVSKAVALSKAGGAFLCISAIAGFYLVIVQLCEAVEMPFSLPVGELTRVWTPKKRRG